jgi:hypothetical protein
MQIFAYPKEKDPADSVGNVSLDCNLLQEVAALKEAFLVVLRVRIIATLEKAFSNEENIFSMEEAVSDTLR